MYIAFKWLLGLTLGMWLAMCSLDVYIKKYADISEYGGLYIRPLVISNTENRTNPVNDNLNFKTRRLIQHIRDKKSNMAYLHVVMFIAGALALSLYKNFNEIITVTKYKIATIFTHANVEKLQFKIRVTEASKIAMILYKNVLENLKIVATKTIISIHALGFKAMQKPKVNLLLLNKLKDLGEERKKIGQLLIAALHENKNIRTQCQLESMAKNRLVRHIENTQKVMKENRSKYVNFQQLYLITHQENIFLKSRVTKLTREKDETSKNLLELMNEVYKSKNHDLMEFCSRFIVKTKDNLLNSDVGAEIQTFLNNKVRSSEATHSNVQTYDRLDIAVNSTKSWLRCTSCTKYPNIIDNLCLTPLVNEVPKFKGLPGEYVWTVKDKDGLIEKLYEYDCESDLENGETIRRIKEYSVYFDKDCLLDCTNSSSTLIYESRTSQSGPMRSSKASLDYPPTSQRFLTGSAAFQKFMQNNKNVVSSTVLPISPLSH